MTTTSELTTDQVAEYLEAELAIAEQAGAPPRAAPGCTGGGGC